VTFYYAAATMVFVLPQLGITPPANMLKTVTAVLFLIGPLTATAASASAATRARAACEALLDLDRRLAAVADAAPASPRDLAGFDEIELSGVVYQHHESGQPGFAVGPVTLVLHRGDVLFISGGNGAGKSTLLKLLTALYRPQAGEIRVDGIPVRGGIRDAYQSLFATVFADFHLFRRLHGLRHVVAEEVERWLERMEIADKVRLENGRFQTIRLSAGQRRRLALVVAALEDRPIYVFDEWAADQDPSFRRKFYDEILPLLRARDKTIVAVTHDERYLDRATRHLRMDEGRLLEAGRD
jgi:putative ATP-binding cassette transporter